MFYQTKNGSGLPRDPFAAIHLRDDCLTDEGRFDVLRYKPLTRLGYQDFGAITETLRMRRPKL